MQTGGVRLLGKDVSCHGMVIKVPGEWALSGLKAYKCLQCGKAGPIHWQEPDSSAELARDAP
jgi:hypothetical protein